jgi:hypothetical protein
MSHHGSSHAPRETHPPSPSRVFAFAACVALGCGGGSGTPSDAASHADAALSCADVLPEDCQPAFPPAYPMIYENLLLKTCGAPATGGSCHSAMGKQGGLVLSDIDTAYTALLTDKNKDGRTRVNPGDPACSLLEERLESTNPALRMPLGAMPLPASVRCAVRQWIANGAQRQ